MKLGSVDVSVRARRSFFFFLWLWLQPLIHQSYFPPFPSPIFPSSNLSFPLPIPLPSLTSPESSQSSSISASLSQSVCQFSPGPLNHQVALQPHAPFSWCLASPTAPLPPVHYWHAAGRSDSQRTDSLLSVYVRTYSRHSSLDLTLQEKIHAQNRWEIYLIKTSCKFLRVYNLVKFDWIFTELATAKRPKW